MAELSLPQIPTKSSINAKVAAYTRNAEAHKRGEHKVTPARSMCKACNDAKKARRS